MKTISLCMIVKNEAATLPHCLSSIKDVVDEIIIVDTGSTDNTVKIARQFTDKIVHFEWTHDFAAARNFAFSLGVMDYLMWLDADDVLTPEDRRKLRTLKQKLTNEDVITTKYNCTHDEYGNVTLQSIRERLVSRSYFDTVKWEGGIHEIIPVQKDFKGRVFHSDVVITHTSNHNPSDTNSPEFKRNFEILERTVNREEHSLVNSYYYACSLKALHRYDDALKWLHKYFNMPEIKDYGDVNAYLVAHDIYLEKGDLNAAYKILADNERQNAHMAEYYTALGRFFQKHVNDAQKAEGAYKKALRCTGISHDGIMAIGRSMDYYYFLPYVGLGELATATGDYKKALMYYEKALSYKPNDPIAGRIFEKLKQIVEME